MITFDDKGRYKIIAEKIPSYSDEETFNLKSDEHPSEVLVIPEGFKTTGELSNISIKHSEWKPMEGVKEVVCPSTLECIGNLSFANCEISKIKFNDGLKYIKTSAFNYCGNDWFKDIAITELDIPDSVEYIGCNSFAFMHQLKKVRLSHKLEVINKKTFMGCDLLEEIEIPESVELIRESAFEGCTNLKKIKLPQGIKWIEKNAFKGTKINIDDLGLSFCKDGFAVKGDGVAAYYYGDAEEVVIPSHVKAIGVNCFSGTDVKKVVLGDNVESIEVAAFEKCEKLETVVLNKNIKLIPKRCFAESSIAKVEGNLSGLRCVGNHAFASTKITSFKFPEGFEVVGVSAFSKCSELEEVVFESGFKEIRNGAFYNCRNLKTIISPEMNFDRIANTAFIINEPCSANNWLEMRSSYQSFVYKTSKDDKGVEIESEKLRHSYLSADSDSQAEMERSLRVTNEEINKKFCDLKKELDELLIKAAVVNDDDGNCRALINELEDFVKEERVKVLKEKREDVYNYRKNDFPF